MKVLVTGGTGFIGSNVCMSFANKGHEVIALDNLSREGTEKNLSWLKENKNITFIKTDIREYFNFGNFDVIVHLASQTGVIPSIDDPQEDFSVNAQGTLNILEYARKQESKPLVIFASTNKVYGDIRVDKPVTENESLSFCTPYGCSKGAGDQYMLDYYRVYGVKTVVLRMSCIYGDRQLGTERENGWLCHFMRNKDKPVTIYGDGTQQRDALYIDDYVSLLYSLIWNEDKVKGQVFNIGGGPENIVSVNEVLKKIGNTKVTYADWRPSDQKYYVSDISKIKRFTGWKPTIGIDEGLERLGEWVKEL